MTVLDFGCGPGSFSIAAAELVGREGRVFAVDIHPLALQSVQRRAERHDLGQLQAISAHDLASVPNASVDVVLLFDVLHELSEVPWALPGLRRVLRRDGALLVTDHHLSLPEIAEHVTRGGGFALSARTRRSCDSSWTRRVAC